MFNLEDVRAAWMLVRQGTQSAGVDGITINLFAKVASEELRDLQRQLQQECYAASPAKGFYLRKKSGGKRLIGITTVRDHIVHRVSPG